MFGNRNETITFGISSNNNEIGGEAKNNEKRRKNNMKRNMAPEKPSIGKTNADNTTPVAGKCPLLWLPFAKIINKLLKYGGILLNKVPPQRDTIVGVRRNTKE